MCNQIIICKSCLFTLASYNKSLTNKTCSLVICNCCWVTSSSSPKMKKKYAFSTMQTWFFFFWRREIATLTSFVYLLNYSDDLVDLVLIWLLRLSAKVSSVPQSSKIGFLRPRDTAVSGESKYYGLCNRLVTIKEAPWAFLLLWNECCTGKIASTKKPACFCVKRPREDDRAYGTTGQAREIFSIDRSLQQII